VTLDVMTVQQVPWPKNVFVLRVGEDDYRFFDAEREPQAGDFVACDLGHGVVIATAIEIEGQLQLTGVGSVTASRSDVKLLGVQMSVEDLRARFREQLPPESRSPQLP
jgi:hypothetical protein